MNTVSSFNVGDGGVKRSELVNWYLKEHEEEISSEEELLARKLLVEKVIDRLINHVSCVPTKIYTTVYIHT